MAGVALGGTTAGYATRARVHGDDMADAPPSATRATSAATDPPLVALVALIPQTRAPVCELALGLSCTQAYEYMGNASV